MILVFFIASNIINFRRNYTSINENFYPKSRSEVVKFFNFEIPSHNIAAPSVPILLDLINFKFQCQFKFYSPSNIVKLRRN